MLTLMYLTTLKINFENLKQVHESEHITFNNGQEFYQKEYTNQFFIINIKIMIVYKFDFNVQNFVTKNIVKKL